MNKCEYLKNINYPQIKHKVVNKLENKKICNRNPVNKGFWKKKVDNVYNFVDNFGLILKNKLFYPHFVYNMFITLVRTGILSTKVESIKILMKKCILL